MKNNKNVSNIIEKIIGIEEKWNDYHGMVLWFTKNKHINIIKFGIDPSGCGLHFGHIFILHFLNELIKDCHWIKVYIILGTFTVKIGDPSGKKNIKKNNEQEDITYQNNTHNIKIFITKLFNNKNFVFMDNHTWLSKINIAEFLDICKYIDVRDIFDRKEFKNRYSRIKINELLYPIFQSYDSIYLNNHIEIGGIDQLFNFKNTRTIQKKMSLSPQICIFISLLTDINNIKIGKSQGNSILINNHTSPKRLLEYLMLLDDETVVYIHSILCLCEKKNIISNIRDKLNTVVSIMNFFINVFELDHQELCDITEQFTRENIDKQHVSVINIKPSISLKSCLQQYIFNSKSNSQIKTYLKHNKVYYNDKILLKNDLNNNIKDGDIIKISKKKTFLIRMI